MTLQFKRKYSTQGSGAPCHVSIGFFSGFVGIFLPKLQMDPRPESTTQPKAQGYSIWSAILQSHFHISFSFKTTWALLKTFKSGTRGAWDYSRRLQDCSDVSWSTFQPRDASTTPEDF
jgi:hypothetical protein